MGKGLATKKNELFLKLEKKNSPKKATKLEGGGKYFFCSFPYLEANIFPTVNQFCQTLIEIFSGLITV